jgi:hypothetical protein
VSREVVLESVAPPPLSGFHGIRIGGSDVSSASVTLEHRAAQTARARPEE